MGRDKCIGSIDFSVDASLKPWQTDPSAYTQEVIGRISAVPKGSLDDRAEPGGEIRLLVIKLSEAIEEGVHLSRVFASYSADLEEVYRGLFSGDEFKDELGVDALGGDLLYVDDVALEPGHRHRRALAQIVETAVATFASQGVVAGYRSVLDFGARDWQRLGFREVPGTDLILRDNFAIDRTRIEC